MEMVSKTQGDMGKRCLNVLGGLVDHDGVVGLVLDLTLGPLLLLTNER